MKFSEYMINKFNNGDRRSVLLWGEGGLGKTYSLLDLYENLNKEDFYFDSKKLVPLYIPLNEFCVSGISDEDSRFIRKYIWSQYTGQIIDENTVNNIDNKILNVFGNAYHFVLLCDGLNECANAVMLFSEINKIATYTNVTVCLTSRTKLNDFEHFDNIELCPLSIEQVRSIIAHHCNDLSINESLVNLLQIPFYLNLWLGLPDSQKNEQYTKSKLLEKYIKNLLCNQKKNNSATERIKLADNFKVDYFTAIDYVEKFLWSLSWVSEKNNTMVVSVGDEMWKSAKELYTEEMYRSAQITRLQEELFDNFLIPLGLFKKAKNDSYTYTHQIYRDFFAVQYMHCDNFDAFEHKISKNNISDTVIELFGGLFIDADEDLYTFMHKINARISGNEELKKNVIVNRNIVRLFREASCTIENEDFSNRDLSCANLNEFVNLINCDFSNSIFSDDTLWVGNESWVSTGSGKIYCVNKKLIFVADFEDVIFDCNNGNQIKILDSNDEIYKVDPSECFQYKGNNYIAHGTITEKVVLINIEEDSRTEIEYKDFDSIQKIIYSPVNASLYIWGYSKQGHLNKEQILIIYNMDTKSIEIVNNIVSLGNTQNGDEFFYYGPQIGLNIVGNSGTHTLEFPRNSWIGTFFNEIIDCYFVNGKWIIVTDTYISVGDGSFSIEYLSPKFKYKPSPRALDFKIMDFSYRKSLCGLEFGLIRETCFDPVSEKIFILVGEGSKKQLLSYDLGSSRICHVLTEVASITDRGICQNSMFIVDNRLFVFGNMGITIINTKNEKFEDFSFVSLNLNISNVTQINKDGFFIKGFSANGEVKIQRIDNKCNIIYEKRAHLCPEFGFLSVDEDIYYISLLDHNGNPKIAVFNHDLQLKEMRMTSDTIKSFYEFQKNYQDCYRVNGSIYGHLKKLDLQCEYVSLGTVETGIFIFKYDRLNKSYVQHCHISSGYDIMPFRLVNNGDALIPNLYDAKINVYFDKHLIISGKINEKAKFFIIDLEKNDYSEINLQLFECVTFFKDSPYLLCTKEKKVFFYNVNTNLLRELRYKSKKQDNVLKLIRDIDGDGLFFENHLWWISKSDGKYYLNDFSNESNIRSVSVCSSWRKAKLNIDPVKKSVFVIDQCELFDDKDKEIYVNVFDYSEEKYPNKKTYKLIDEPISFYDGKAFFFQKKHNATIGEEYRTSPSWYKCNSLCEDDKCYIFPFDKNLNGSNFTGVQLTDIKKTILLQYGAKPFENTQEE